MLNLQEIKDFLNENLEFLNTKSGQDLLKHLAASQHEAYIRAVASCSATCKETLNYIFERIAIYERWPGPTIYVVCLDILENRSIDGRFLDRIFEALEKVDNLGVVERMLIYRDIVNHPNVSSETLGKFICGREEARMILASSEKATDEQLYILLKDTSLTICKNAAKHLKQRYPKRNFSSIS